MEPSEACPDQTGLAITGDMDLTETGSGLSNLAISDDTNPTETAMAKALRKPELVYALCSQIYNLKREPQPGDLHNFYQAAKVNHIFFSQAVRLLWYTMPSKSAWDSLCRERQDFYIPFLRVSHVHNTGGWTDSALHDLRNYRFPRLLRFDVEVPPYTPVNEDDEGMHLFRPYFDGNDALRIIAIRDGDFSSILFKPLIRILTHFAPRLNRIFFIPHNDYVFLPPPPDFHTCLEDMEYLTWLHIYNLILPATSGHVLNWAARMRYLHGLYLTFSP
ncbi:hypothetical protein EJ08DRAFT_246112 [Tothia fuscella]|uniref:Uncharacterized protein n=1 Tax=Tothia fuscella TaxID=1048955 RepID=A0A9P4TYU7_9PEZI|nr:hypothetical protein EJ08DRAFT_246112 [Tothia fuscella]